MVHARIIEDFGEFQIILPAWERMLSRCPLDNIFLSHPYLTTWWQHFGKDHRLFVILIEENGSSIAAAPLCIRELRIFGYKLRLLEIIGTGPVPTRPMGLSDRVGLPVISGRDDALDMIFDVLLENRFQWDIIYLKGVNLTDNFSVTHMKQILSPEGQKITSAVRYYSPYLTLRGTFDDYKKSRSRNFRKQLARHRKKLLGMGSLEIEKGENASPQEIVEEVLGLMQRSTKGHMGTALFLDRYVRDFFQDLLLALSKREWLWVRFLKSGHKRIAHEICFHYSRKLYSYNSAYDMKYHSVSPGTVLTAAIIEEAYSSGVTEYDMLRGDESYKLRWSPTMRIEYEIAIAPPGLRSNLFINYQIHLKPWVKKHKYLASLYPG